MSEGLKEELAKELGFYDVVQKEGWGGIRARDAGNMVKTCDRKSTTSDDGRKLKKIFIIYADYKVRLE